MNFISPREAFFFKKKKLKEAATALSDVDKDR